mgnify:CR=1 FL=1
MLNHPLLQAQFASVIVQDPQESSVGFAMQGLLHEQAAFGNVKVLTPQLVVVPWEHEFDGQPHVKTLQLFPTSLLTVKVVMLLQKSSQTVIGQPKLLSQVAPHSEAKHEWKQDPCATHLS